MVRGRGSPHSPQSSPRWGSPHVIVQRGWEQMSRTAWIRPRIVVGYAHTPAGTAALRWAVTEGQRVGADVEVVHVFDVRRRADVALSHDPETDRGEARHEAAQRVQQAITDLPERGAVRFVERVGQIEEVLATVADGAMRLVLGEPGCRTDQSLPTVLSVHCTVPVTVISEAGHTRELVGQLRRRATTALS